MIAGLFLITSGGNYAFASDGNWVFGNSNPEYNKPSEDWFPKVQQNNPTNIQQDTQQKQQYQSQQPVMMPVVNNYYQGIKIPAGTAITVYNAHEINADDIATGQTVNFIVDNTVNINGIDVIKAGTQATAEVTNKRNNFIFGIPGEIQVNNFRITNVSNKPINMSGSIIKKGNSRYWAHIGWIIVWPLLLVKGEDGIIPAGTRHTIYTIGDSFVNIGNVPVNYQTQRYY